MMELTKEHLEQIRIHDYRDIENDNKNKYLNCITALDSLLSSHNLYIRLYCWQKIINIYY